MAGLWAFFVWMHNNKSIGSGKRKFGTLCPNVPSKFVILPAKFVQLLHKIVQALNDFTTVCTTWN